MLCVIIVIHPSIKYTAMIRHPQIITDFELLIVSDHGFVIPAVVTIAGRLT